MPPDVLLFSLPPDFILQFMGYVQCNSMFILDPPLIFFDKYYTHLLHLVRFTISSQPTSTNGVVSANTHLFLSNFEGLFDRTNAVYGDQQMLKKYETNWKCLIITSTSPFPTVAMLATSA